MILSIIIPTKNEARHITACIDTVSWARAAGSAEIIVVDNASTDGTAKLAEDAGAKVYCQGPERSAQRNRGASESSGRYLLFLDADMLLRREALDEVLSSIGGDAPPDAMYIREEMAGKGAFTALRNFERSFYDATCIDALRVIRKDLFEKVGGYDEGLCGPEDWDMDRKILQATTNVKLTQESLLHNEDMVSFKSLVRKKKYYARTMAAYRAKWKNDSIVKKQLGVMYRFFGVFFENGKWKKSLSRPHMLIAVWFYRAVLCMLLLSAMTKGRRDDVPVNPDL